jgi:hypothetical protein
MDYANCIRHVLQSTKSRVTTFDRFQIHRLFMPCDLWHGQRLGRMGWQV